MAKFAAALLVLCLVFVAAVQVPQVHAVDVYGDCLPGCLKACVKDNGYTFCEMKCDTDCFNKEIEIQVPKVHADVYGDCLPDCLKGCEKDNGYTFCEMKCDTDCFNKDFDSRLNKAPTQAPSSDE
ncbi:hypothetical protein Dsin_029651 [Dipteronia sinensis]|uniref:Uncharacterized protein n=1 Tax=Dipteronia sinensis TaxID=43782 RepID=A0AAE0DVK5_9ROSI|nr:hypothetical protein Dsin_029651 [Dipteronia sinensis]